MNSRNRSTARREKLQRTVKIVSALMLVIYVVRFVLSVSVFELSDSSFTIPFSLGVAYCGLVGANRLHKDILSCFYFCCLASVFLYVVNVMIQTRQLVLAKNSKNEPPEDDEEESVQTNFGDLRLVMLTVIGLETLLAILQLIGASRGRELVRSHLDVRVPDRNFLSSNNAFAVELAQQQQRQSLNQLRTALNNSESALSDDDINNYLNSRYTIANIPVKRFSTQNKTFTSVDSNDDASVGEVSIEMKNLSSVEQSTNGATAPVQATSMRQLNETNEMFHPGEDYDDICVVCQDDFRDGQNVKILPCNHFFHVECIDKWLERTLACPICLRPLPLITMYNSETVQPEVIADEQPASSAQQTSTVLRLT